MTLIRPPYAEGGLADVLPLALRMLATGEARRVVVLLVDGLGLHLLPVAAPAAPTLADVLAGRLGSLSAYTAGFPSTTPTSLTSLGTGALPGAHGILGFTVNIPGTDRTLTHVTWADDPEPSEWQPLPSRLAAAGVSTAVFGPAAHAGSGLTRAAYGDTPYTGATLDTLADQILASDARLTYAYHPTVDALGHWFGVGSPEWLAEVAAVDGLLTRLVDGLGPDTALLVTADHGMLNVTADDKLDFDAAPQLQAGVRVFAGEPRVRYLHTRPGATADVLAAWRAALGEDAWVVERAEAVAGGWFGPVPEGHLRRIGDVIVACRGTRVVVATEREATASRLVGYHGSATAAELAIPLIVIPSG